MLCCIEEPSINISDIYRHTKKNKALLLIELANTIEHIENNMDKHIAYTYYKTIILLQKVVC